MTSKENVEAFKKEAELASSILRRNRYSTVPPYKWYGPDPEPPKRTLRQLSRDLINKTLTVNSDDLAPWQLWYIEHLYCGGEFELMNTRHGQVLICTCYKTLGRDREKP
jgi:hypothetical protein